MQYTTSYHSPFGEITIACDSEGKNLVGVWLEGQKYAGGTLSKTVTTEDSLPLFQKTKNWLDRYFAGEKPGISELPLAPVGSEFRQGVWSILREIPYGEVTSYSAIAKKMAQITGKKNMSSQAVGGAVGHNPISIIIPCHRVVGAHGNLTGYAGGIPLKIKLLELEGVDMSGLFTPKKGTAL